jgi:hypothetical protein
MPARASPIGVNALAKRPSPSPATRASIRTASYVGFRPHRWPHDERIPSRQSASRSICGFKPSLFVRRFLSSPSCISFLPQRSRCSPQSWSKSPPQMDALSSMDPIPHYPDPNRPPLPLFPMPVWSFQSSPHGDIEWRRKTAAASTSSCSVSMFLLAKWQAGPTCSTIFVTDKRVPFTRRKNRSLNLDSMAEVGNKICS